MRIVCLVKFVPDAEQITYDYEKNVLVRENVRLVINPEDATCLAHALAVKAQFPESTVETVTMAPKGVMPHLADLVRRGVDRAVLISDPLYVGSDTYVTSKILARHLRNDRYRYIMTGTHTLDGGTGHVPAQLAELLELPHVSNIVSLDRQALDRERATVDVDSEALTLTFQIDAPAILGFAYSTKHKLPYISSAAIDADVSDRIDLVTNDELGFAPEQVGIAGSPTQVASVTVETLERKTALVVEADDDGVDAVYAFLADKGFLRR